MFMFALFASLSAYSPPLLQVHYYVVSPNGIINTSFASGGLTGFLSATNSGGQGLIGWGMTLIPFIVILVGLGYAMQDIFPAGMVASVVAASISVIGTGIGSPPLISNITLYLFISLTTIFGILSLIKGILNPYGN